MHPKSFVSNFWGAVQQLMQWLFYCFSLKHITSASVVTNIYNTYILISFNKILVKQYYFILLHGFSNICLTKQELTITKR